jgi:hypothetical protein
MINHAQHSLRVNDLHHISSIVVYLPRYHQRFLSPSSSLLLYHFTHMMSIHVLGYKDVNSISNIWLTSWTVSPNEEHSTTDPTSNGDVLWVYFSMTVMLWK